MKGEQPGIVGPPFDAKPRVRSEMGCCSIMPECVVSQLAALPAASANNIAPTSLARRDGSVESTGPTAHTLTTCQEPLPTSRILPVPPPPASRSYMPRSDRQNKSTGVNRGAGGEQTAFKKNEALETGGEFQALCTTLRNDASARQW